MSLRFRIHLLVVLLTAVVSGLSAQSPSVLAASSVPKREFRGAWIATVTNLDWPSSRGLSPATQRSQLTAILDNLAASGVNAVIFQVRPECDAFYNSPYEPWSYWLTGTQGTAPGDGYDPLTFAVTEAHTRGMEIHAWFNPYRAYRETDTYPTAANHVTKLHPEWVLTCPDGYKFLNPGLQEVRDFVAKVIADVVRRYDVDGVHMDDYFYPYPEHGFTKEDTSTFHQYPRGFAFPDSLAPWRRDNVNLLIHQIYDSVQAIRPVVKVGMSPFGIWKNGVPQGIAGMDAYSTIYCDAVAWISGKYIDYITPQLYWGFGGGQDYALLQPWWVGQATSAGRQLYTGNYAPLGISTIGAQIDFNRNSSGASGCILFRAGSVTGSFASTLSTTSFRSPSIIPVMGWKDTTRPQAPSNLAVSGPGMDGNYQLTWNAPAPSGDGDSIRRYVVYRFTQSSVLPSDADHPVNMLALTGVTSRIPPARIDSANVQYYYAVSAFDRNNNESGLSNVVPISAAVQAPMLATPAEGEQNFARGGALTWQSSTGAMVYRLELASAPDFGAGALVASLQTADTTALTAGLQAQTTYYWRVAAGNQGSASPYASPASFHTGWPLPPALVSPVGITNVPLKPTFVWRKCPATSYHIRVLNIASLPGVVVIDTVVTDTTLVCQTTLQALKNHSWTVTATNSAGESDLSVEARFRTTSIVSVTSGDGTVPMEYLLAQNYPNPFNPTTTIAFSVAQSGMTTLKVYDLLGREVATLIEDVVPMGTYSIVFEADRLPSGTYFYVLTSGPTRMVKKMMLLK